MGIALCKNGHLIHAGGFGKNGYCTACAVESVRRWREKNQDYNKNWREKNPHYASMWRQLNPESNKKYCARWAKNNQEKVQSLHRGRVVEVADQYIADLMQLKTSDIPKEIIELKRQHIILKREIKKWKQSQL